MMESIEVVEVRGKALASLTFLFVILIVACLVSTTFSCGMNSADHPSPGKSQTDSSQSIEKARKGLSSVAKFAKNDQLDSLMRFVQFPFSVECYGDFSKGATFADAAELQDKVWKVFDQPAIDAILAFSESAKDGKIQFPIIDSVLTLHVNVIYHETWDDGEVTESGRVIVFVVKGGRFVIDRIFCAG